MTILQDLLEFVQTVLRHIRNVIDEMTTKIVRGLADVFANIKDSIGNMVGNIVDVISDMMNRIVNALQNIFGSLIDKIKAVVESAISTIGSAISGVVNAIRDTVENVAGFFSNLFAKIKTGIDTLVQSTAEQFLDIANRVKQNLQAIVNSVILFFDGIFNTVREGVATILNATTGVVTTLTDAIKSFVTNVVDVVGNTLRDLLETIANLPDAIGSLADDLIKSAQENIAGPIGKLPIELINTIVESVRGQALDDAETLQVETLNTLFGTSPVVRSPEELRGIITNVFPSNTLLRVLIIAIFSVFIFLGVTRGIASANAEILLQEHARENPYRIIEPPDAVKAIHYNLSSEETSIEWLRRWGYTDDVAHALIALGETVPPPGELITWWLREFIDDEQFATSLKAHGWSDASINNLQQAAFFIPPVQDLITMAVRDVFTPDIAQQFGQFEDFPEALVENATKQGVSEEWARNYWAAHWRLPSVQMGFEMLHRGVIDQSQLELLLRASDVMPFWRDKLTEISFSPLTRVDIRRMHRVGVLTEEEVNKAYHDIGYNDENAQRLTEFTIQLNTEEEEPQAEGLVELTRSNIIRFFTDGIFTKAETKAILVDIGESDDAAELFLLSAEMQIEADLRKDEINLVLEQAKGGVITIDSAQDLLNRLDLQELEKQRALNDLLQDAARRNKIPPKGDLDKFYKAGIIGDGEYLKQLKLLGFSDEWANRYLQLIGASSNASEV